MSPLLGTKTCSVAAFLPPVVPVLTVGVSAERHVSAHISLHLHEAHSSLWLLVEP